MCFQKHQPRFPQRVSEADARLLLTFNSFIMKNTNFFIILICYLFILGITSCERTDLQKSSPNDSGKIIPRAEDCEDCPNVSDCCCAVWLEDPDQNAFLQLCGTTDGPNSCSGSPICGILSPSGGGQTINLDDVNIPRANFCMLPGYPFWIYNYHGSDVSNIIISCQAGLTNPDTLHLHIPAGNRFYFETNGSCVLDPCQ